MRDRCLILLPLLASFASLGGFGLAGCSDGPAQTTDGGAGGGQAGRGGGQAGAAAGAGGGAAGAAGSIPSGAGGTGGANGTGGAAGQVGGGSGGTIAGGGGGNAAGGTTGAAGAGTSGSGGAAGQAGAAAPPGLRLLAGGLGGPGNVDGVGATARFGYTGAIASDGAGNFYVTDNTSSTIRKIVIATGAVTTFAGRPGQYGSADGIGVNATFNGPVGIANDGAGNLYVTDGGSRTLRKIVIATGAVTTLAGAPTSWSGTADGIGTDARFYGPTVIAADGAGNLYVTDVIGGDITSHTYLRKIVIATRAVTTVTDWQTNASYVGPGGIASDGAGNLYLTETHAIRKLVVATGALTTLAGAPGQTGSADGTGAAARFVDPHGVAIDLAGNLYVADTGNDTIRKVDVATGAVTTLAHTGAAADLFYGPIGIARDGDGNLAFTDYGNTIGKVVIATAAITTLAGATSHAGSADDTGADARFRWPDTVASDGAGNLYVADGSTHTIRKIVIATGVVTTLAGQPGVAGSVDGAGAEARFNGPDGIAGDGAGNLYVADGGIRKIVIATGAVTTVTNGPGREYGQPGPSGIAIDGAGNLYFANEGTTIWKVAIATGVLTAVAGTAGQQGTADGTGAAARFIAPSGIASDGAGNLYVADGNSIRRIAIATRAVTTLAGKANQQGSVDGSGATARFDSPAGIASDGAGHLYVADGNTIRKIAIATATVSTVIGSPGQVGVALGALPASLSKPQGVVVLPTGELAIADAGENAILIARF